MNIIYILLISVIIGNGNNEKESEETLGILDRILKYTNNIEVIKLNNIYISTKCTEYVIQWLKRYPTLHTLKLVTIHETEALRAICAHMEKNTTLKTELWVIYSIRLVIRYGAQMEM